ncbi:type VI secretion system protein ImpL [Methylobacterium sp. OAE515]|uniref:type VI secretion system membrane subunit TssM n=1 Tax=Methylobacterium sp. OAE515 TaxID=2817895 RepID=UPI00178A5295
MNAVSSLLMQLAGRWGAGLAGWTILSALVWSVFPVVPMLEAPAVRLSAIAALLVVYLAVNGAISWRGRRRRNALAAGMADEAGARAAAEAEAEAEAAEEVAQLREHMKRTLARLQRRGWRKGQLYDQPWFVLIGPPGSGKTTALMNSGLHLPLGEDGGKPSLPGVGGTRLCDWWFADEAVLIDTAGRYTTQDSSAEIDAAGWRSFLDLLLRTRPRQPINGVVVVLSLPDLLTATPAERDAHARAVRLRINEITERLRLRVPVYLVLSKADRLCGFDAYFDDLDAEGRGQVWGMTFPLDGGADRFVPEFRLLLGRLEDRQVERLQAERAGERRALIGQFALQVASLEQPLLAFLNLAFSGGRLDPAPFLRGVYLTSATQQGTPIDRLTGMLAASFGIDQTGVPALRPVSGRSYFVTRLVREVILGEALLITRGSGRWRRHALRIAGFALVAASLLAGGSLIFRADAKDRQAVDQAREALATYRQRLSSLPLDPVTDDDLVKVAPVLDAAAELSREVDADPLMLGLSQRNKLAEANRQVYRHALQRILLPRLVWRLEHQMRAEFGNPARLYDTTRIYLMLGSQGPLEPDAVRARMRADWDVRFPTNLDAPLRTSLSRHLDVLLAERLPEIQLDGALVDSARAAFSRVTLAERVYGRLRTSAAALSLPEWTAAAALGADGRRLFTRLSRRPLGEGIPGLYSGRGYRDVLQPTLPGVARAAAAESWVLGRAEQVPTEEPQISALEEAVLSLYAADYKAHWDALLGDLALEHLNGQEKAVRDLYVLSSPQSPIRDLLTAISQELRIPDGATDRSVAPPDRPSSTSGGTPVSAPISPALRSVEGHYRALADLVNKGEASPLTNILRLINDLQQVLAAAAPGGAPLQDNLQRSGDPAQLLTAEADRQPIPLSNWLREIATSGSQILGTSTRASAAGAYAAADGPLALCHAVVDGHYPFDANSRLDAPIDDFSRLFAPGGQFDTYFQRQIRGFVDTRGPTWQVRTLGGIAPPLDAAAAAAFQQAAAIRAVFFPAGNSPQLSFSLVPASNNDPAASLTIGATTVSKDPNQAATFTWPSGGLSAASLTFDDQPAPDPGVFGGLAIATSDPRPTPASLQFTGTWALFKLLDHARATPGRSSTAFDLTIVAGGRRAAYVLQAGSALNPFSRNPLRGFRCPTIR